MQASEAVFFLLFPHPLLLLPCSPSPAGAPKKEVYFMAIIDILTPYDAKKKAAHAAKTVKHGVSPPCCPTPPTSWTPPGTPAALPASWSAPSISPWSAGHRG